MTAAERDQLSSLLARIYALAPLDRLDDPLWEIWAELRAVLDHAPRRVKEEPGEKLLERRA